MGVKKRSFLLFLQRGNFSVAGVAGWVLRAVPAIVSLDGS